jgi:hypothetical protein
VRCCYDIARCIARQTRDRCHGRSAVPRTVLLVLLTSNSIPEEQITSKDIEALPGLTKIETIDYHWLVNRADPRGFREQMRLPQLADKHRAALAESANVLAQGSDTEPLKKIGDLVIRYVDERAPTPKPGGWQKARRLIKALLRLDIKDHRWGRQKMVMLTIGYVAVPAVLVGQAAALWGWC